MTNAPRAALRVASLLPFIVAGTASRSAAVETRFWNVQSRVDLEECELDGVSLDADGVIALAPDTKPLAESTETYFWEVVRSSRGDVLVGTGDGGEVLRVDSGATEAVQDLELLEVMALAVAPDGTIYAAGAPGGKIFAIAPGGAVRVFFDTEQGVVWDLALLPGGDLLAATGDRGQLVRIDPAGEGKVLYESTDPHLMCIDMLAGGDVVFGTAGDGLVCRVDASGSVHVLYDAEEEEIRAVVVAPDGAVYAAANPSRESAGEGEGGDESEKRPSVYRIQGIEGGQLLWRGDPGVVFDLALSGDGALVVGTGEPARIYRIDPRDRRATRVAELDEKSVLTVTWDRDRLLASTGDPARLYTLTEELRRKGSVTSSSRDAGARAGWSRIRWTGETVGGEGVTFETRTGDRAEPDQTWSDWQAAVREPDGSYRIESAAARFLQWRLWLSGSGSATPRIARVTTSYREVNLAPQVKSLEVSAKGAEILAGPESANRSVRRRMAGGVEIDYTLPYDTGGMTQISPAEAQWALGLRTVAWTAVDPNGDDLTFDLFYRPLESEKWLPLAEDIEDLVYTWDTRTFADGEYRIKVVASDEPGNAEGALTGEWIGAPFEVDNTPPVVDSIEASLEGEEVRIAASAQDARSAIVRADVTFDGVEWRPARPAQGLLDARSLRFDLRVEAGERGKGDPVVLRLLDEAGNQVVKRAFIK